MSSKQSGRRRFLKDGAVLAGLAVGAIRSPASRGQEAGSEQPGVRSKGFRAYGERSRFATSVRLQKSQGSTSSFAPLQDQQGIITPSALHFVQSLYSSSGDPLGIDPRQHRLLIHGLVDRPLIFSMDELQRLPSVSRIHFIECEGNSRFAIRGKNDSGTAETAQEIHGLTSCAEWTGVLLSVLLREAGVQKGASWLIAEGADKNKAVRSIPLEKALDDVIVAYGQNGEVLRPENGFPLRLMVPGWDGNINVKWLRRIKVVDQPYMTHQESATRPSVRLDGKARWFQWEMGPKSVITRPSGGQRLPGRGFYAISGLAWSAGGAIRRVEVSTDGGRSWKDARLDEPVHRVAFTRFCVDWNWNGEESVLQSRCTDERGDVQPTLAELGKIWDVPREYWQATTNHINHFNPIFPWKVTREGSVQNALS